MAGRHGGQPVLAGYDGSPASKHALAYAAGLARRGDHWLVVEIIWRTGDPTAELLKITAEWHADAIVIGTSRRLRNVISLPTRLARHARCPAVVVP
jgi:nucleotide-binding universal stress UspA family protein